MSKDDVIKYLTASIGKSCILLSIPLPDDINLHLICETIANAYGYSTYIEVYKAIEMNVTGKLDVKTQCYGKITVEYISDCLVNYETFRNNVIKKMNDKKQKLSEPPREEIVPEVMFNCLKEWHKKYNELPQYWDWACAYIHYLEITRYTDDELSILYDDFKQKRIREVDQSAKYSYSRRDRDNVLLLKSEVSITNEFYKNMLNEYFNEKRSTSVNNNEK